MQSTRRARLESVLQKELSVFISRELKDPRVPSLTITAVEVTPDGGYANVFISLLGASLSQMPEESQKKDQVKKCLEGLASAAGFLRRHLAQVLNVRHIPELKFRQDVGFDNATRVYELLKQITPKESSSS
jgi:ribosome-binding factor A